MKDSDLDFSSPRSVEKQVNGECRIMIQLILTEEQQRILDPSAEPVVVLDRSGRLVVPQLCLEKRSPRLTVVSGRYR